MICITSRIGVRNRRTRSEYPAQMPSGSPMSSDSSTAAITRARVSTAISHTPSTPNEANPASDSRPSRQPPSAQPSAPAATISPGQPIACRPVCSTLTSTSMNSRM